MSVFIPIFLVGSVKRLFPQECVSAVYGFGSNRKRVTSYSSVTVSFVLSWTVSEIPQVFALMNSPLFHCNFGVFPLHQIAHVVARPSTNLKLMSHKIIFEVFQPMCPCDYGTWTSRTDRRTDDKRTMWPKRANCLEGTNKTALSQSASFLSKKGCTIITH